MKNGYYEVGDAVLMENMHCAIFISKSYYDSCEGEEFFLKHMSDCETVLTQEQALGWLEGRDLINYKKYHKI